MNETPIREPQKSDHLVAVLTIVATTLVLMTCIAGCSAVLITLAYKIP